MVSNLQVQHRIFNGDFLLILQLLTKTLHLDLNRGGATPKSRETAPLLKTLPRLHSTCRRGGGAWSRGSCAPPWRTSSGRVPGRRRRHLSFRRCRRQMSSFSRCRLRRRPIAGWLSAIEKIGLLKQGCGVAQTVARRLAVWQARVRIEARHPRGGPLPSGSNEEIKSDARWIIYIKYYMHLNLTMRYHSCVFRTVSSSIF